MAKEWFIEFAGKWGPRYLVIIRMWESAWPEFVSFRDYDAKIRRVICLTNAIESPNARYPRTIRNRGHFPTNKPRSSACIWPLVL